MGRHLNHAEAVEDGFDSLNGLIKALSVLNVMTEEQVFDCEWGILSFRWPEGYPRRVAKEDRPYYVRGNDEKKE